MEEEGEGAPCRVRFRFDSRDLCYDFITVAKNTVESRGGLLEAIGSHDNYESAVEVELNCVWRKLYTCSPRLLSEAVKLAYFDSVDEFSETVWSIFRDFKCLKKHRKRKREIRNAILRLASFLAGHVDSFASRLTREFGTFVERWASGQWNEAIDSANEEGSDALRILVRLLELDNKLSSFAPRLVRVLANCSLHELSDLIARVVPQLDKEELFYDRDLIAHLYRDETTALSVNEAIIGELSTKLNPMAHLASRHALMSFICVPDAERMGEDAIRSIALPLLTSLRRSGVVVDVLNDAFFYDKSAIIGSRSHGASIIRLYFDLNGNEFSFGLPYSLRVLIDNLWFDAAFAMFERLSSTEPMNNWPERVASLTVRSCNPFSTHAFMELYEIGSDEERSIIFERTPEERLLTCFQALNFVDDFELYPETSELKTTHSALLRSIRTAMSARPPRVRFYFICDALMEGKWRLAELIVDEVKGVFPGYVHYLFRNRRWFAQDQVDLWTDFSEPRVPVLEDVVQECVQKYAEAYGETEVMNWLSERIEDTNSVWLIKFAIAFSQRLFIMEGKTDEEIKLRLGIRTFMNFDQFAQRWIRDQKSALRWGLFACLTLTKPERKAEQVAIVLNFCTSDEEFIHVCKSVDPADIRPCILFQIILDSHRWLEKKRIEVLQRAIDFVPSFGEVLVESDCLDCALRSRVTSNDFQCEILVYVLERIDWKYKLRRESVMLFENDLRRQRRIDLVERVARTY